MAQKKNNSRKGVRRTAAKESTRSAPAARAVRQESAGPSISSEAAVLFLFAFSILLLLGNFGLGGLAGQFFKNLQTGLFGLLGYVFPVFLIIAGIYGIANRWNRRAVTKIAAAFFAMIVFAALIHILFGETGEGTDWKKLFEAGHAGGLLGGGLCLMLYGFLGKIGGFLVLTVILILLLVLITERSFVGAVRNGGGKAYRHAKEDIETFREERRQRIQEKRRVLEMRNSGGNIDLGSTDLSVYGGADPAAAVSDEFREEYPEEYPGEEGRPSLPENEPRYSGSAAGYTEDVQSGPFRDASDTARYEYDPATGSYVLVRGGQREIPEIPAAPAEFPEIPKIVKPSPVFADSDPIIQEAFRKADEILSSSGGAVPRDGDAKTARGTEDHGSRVPAFDVPEPGAAPAANDIPAPAAYDIPAPAAYDVPAPAAYDVPAPDMTAAPHSIPASAGTSASETEEAKAAEETVRRYTVPAPVEISREDDVLPEIPEAERPVWSDEDFTPPEERVIVTASGKIIDSEVGEVEKRMANGERYGKDLSGIKVKQASRGPSPVYYPKDGTATASESSAGSAGGKTGIALSAGPQPVTAPSEKAEKKEYLFPPLDLLNLGDGPMQSDQKEQCARTAARLQETLHSFGVEVTVTNFSCGPRVTRYEIQPAMGVKVNSIVGLSDDIKLSLAAADIRIEAPIPGKSAVGIEVPNEETKPVYFRELLESQPFRNSKAKIAFAVGKDIGGQTVVADIAKMPHVLIAGATGSGKSVCINTLIMSILYRYTPDEVKMIMVDPKVVELSVYNDIPHLLIPVVTDPKKASAALDWAVREMEDRYRKFTKYGVKELSRYNEKIEEAKRSGTVDPEELPEPMPQIVIIIDELADLMMVCKNDVEASICRLAQLARAAGMHLVIATQRPSVNVITGLIKANVPSRIAFMVSSGVDSRTILDSNGAEKLLGKGDMLFAPQSAPRPMRVQGAMITDQEVQRVVDFIKEEAIPLSYTPGSDGQITLGLENAGVSGQDRRDDLFAQAGRYIIDKKTASIGNLQRAFRIGFNRAARIMDQLAEAGVVGEAQGTKSREILMTPEQFEELVRQG